MMGEAQQYEAISKQTDVPAGQGAASEVAQQLDRLDAAITGLLDRIGSTLGAGNPEVARESLIPRDAGGMSDHAQMLTAWGYRLAGLADHVHNARARFDL